MSMATTREFSPQLGTLAYGSISGTNAGTANTVATLEASSRMLAIKNDTDVSLGFTYNGETFIYLPAGQGMVVDAAANNLSFNGARVVGVHRDGTAPASGRVQVLVS